MSITNPKVSNKKGRIAVKKVKSSSLKSHSYKLYAIKYKASTSFRPTELATGVLLKSPINHLQRLPSWFKPAIKASAISVTTSAITLVLALGLVACDKTPPDYRPEVTLPEYTVGDAKNGKLVYKEACTQCHQLTPGLNKKGPQLLNVYGAPAALLKDYNYSQSLQDSGWTWDAETLDSYIADPVKVLPESKMLSDPMPDAKERTDIIAYLSTLRAPVPTDPNTPPTEQAQ